MTPLHLKLKNFFSHKESEIDFSLFDSALLIGNLEGDYNISNGSGKSAIFEGILWCLFNKTRAAAMNDIIMWGEVDCLAELIFSHEGETYKIIRKRSRVTSLSNVFFFMLIDGNWEDISGSTSSLTNSEIVKRIRFDYKTFINSAYFRQNDISEFAESDAGKRKGILKSIIDISKWDEYEEDVKLKLRNAKNEVKILEALCKDYDKIKETCQRNEILYSETLEKSKKDSSMREDVEKKISKLSEAYSDMKKSIDTDQWDNVSEKIELTKRLVSEKNNKKNKIQKSIQKYEKEVLNLKKTKEENERRAESIILIDNAEKLLEELRKEITTHKAESSAANSRLKELREANLLEGECYVCGSFLEKEVYDKLLKEHNDSITTYRRKKIFSENKLKELSEKSEKYEKSIREKRKKDSLLNSAKNIGMQIKVATDHLNSLSNQFQILKKEVLDLEKSIKTNEKILTSLRNEDFNNLRKQIISLRKEKVNLDESLKETNMNLGIYHEKVGTAKNRLEDMEESRKNLSLLFERIDILTKLRKIFGKNGIQTLLLNAVIYDLEDTCNKILNTICTDSFEIILETQRVGSDGVTMVDTLDLKVKKDGVVQNFKSLSGGEKFRVSLAIRISLSEISSRHGGSSLEFLLLDEINSPLDRHGIETLFVNVIKSLEDKYKIMVITHDDTLKERFSNILDVTKSNGESTVNFIRR